MSHYYTNDLINDENMESVADLFAPINCRELIVEILDKCSSSNTYTFINLNHRVYEKFKYDWYVKNQKRN
jgi:hypothetical protein